MDILLVHEIDAANEHIKPMDTPEYIASRSCFRGHPLSNMALLYMEHSVDYVVKYPNDDDSDSED
ncbi:hypothetical protein BDB00DRAFT_813827 [Zychaea mexicana]|uniref:uncharacterized protein n=1 Tax=Zychaea mexicana TaxID=64656 RepID=UPI0022FE5DBE|nr:uncharacterized protein BDB00DRAFT_813827 [Zychaea mexicana]KAI9495566.1 hypothetical protein BDB00DRAFT_813827 [Zychaea mexicana]